MRRGSALLACLLPALCFAQASAPASSPFGQDAAALSYGSDSVGLWVLATGMAICFALGVIAGKQR
jgi:hypothetical protein